jgi:hypothetical protein
MKGERQKVHFVHLCPYLFIIVVINIRPHCSDFLPYIIVLFGSFMRNGYSTQGDISFGAGYHEPIAFFSCKVMVYKKK